LNLCPNDVVVKAGQRVKAGEFLGYLGNCMLGAPATTHHLHLGLMHVDGAQKRFVSPYMTLVRAYERRSGVGTMVAD
jgi:murein DD-endopeptidase MepM/ murein hydrolase activator NlpD